MRVSTEAQLKLLVQETFGALVSGALQKFRRSITQT